MSVVNGSVSSLRAGQSGVLGQVPSSSELLQYVVVPLTAAQLLGMYAAPVAILGLPGTNNSILVHQAFLEVNYGSAQTANGGVIKLQYDSTINGGGVAASGTIAAATLNGVAADTNLGIGGLIGSSGSIALASSRNKPLYISNATAAFITGDSTYKVHVWYQIVYTPA